MVMQFVSAERLAHINAAFAAREESAKRHRDHLWIAVSTYFVNPPLQEGYNLDVENMAMAPTVGCYICEEPFSSVLANRKCMGER